MNKISLKIPTQSTPAIPLGAVVLFEQDGEPLLAVAQGLKKDRYQLLTERARSLELPANRLAVFEIKAKVGLASTELHQFLLALKSQCQKIAQAINLEELWLLVSEFPKAYSSDEIAGLSFPQPSPEQKLAVKILLLSDKTFFKRDKELFLVRPAQVVEDLKRAGQQLAEKQRLRASLVNYFESSGEQVVNIPSELSPLIELLRRYAVGAELGQSEEREAKEITDVALIASKQENPRVSPVAAYSVLERLGIFGPRTNPAWERSGLPTSFPSNYVFESPDLSAEDLEARDQGRQDFSHLDVFTVDDISTRDMDDALSLELSNGNYRLGVHITDVAAEIPMGSPLDRQIERRLSSIYLPERTIHMLPESLSLERLSLIQGEKRRAMSIMIELDRSYNVVSTSIVPSWVVVKRRWTYDQVDDMLESANSEFSTFYEIATALEAQRIELGAMRVQKTEIAVSVDENGKTSLRQIDEESPARSLVAEMAVLVNRSVAEYCRDRHITAIYRGQPISEPEEGEVAPQEGPARDHFIRVRLKRSEAALEARPHAGLGLPAYLQVTSPIRRYVDLINQRQLMAHLSSQPLPYSKTQLAEYLPMIEEGIGLIQKVSKESKRFWLLRYLEQRIEKNEAGAGRKIGGIVVRVNGKHPLVELDEVFFASALKCGRKLNVGERIEVVIGGIDARQDYLRLEAV